VPTDDKGMLLNPGVNGGLFQKQPQQEGAKQVNYITVESIDEYSMKVEKLGGKILMPKQQVPTVGWIAVAEDPERNQFGLLQPEQM
jgi:predicted enzyme related to lactoylglutathione lyase